MVKQKWSNQQIIRFITGVRPLLVATKATSCRGSETNKKRKVRQTKFDITNCQTVVITHGFTHTLSHTHPHVCMFTHNLELAWNNSAQGIGEWDAEEGNKRYLLVLVLNINPYFFFSFSSASVQRENVADRIPYQPRLLKHRRKMKTKKKMSTLGSRKTLREVTSKRPTLTSVPRSSCWFPLPHSCRINRCIIYPFHRKSSVKDRLAHRKPIRRGECRACVSCVQASGDEIKERISRTVSCSTSVCDTPQNGRQFIKVVFLSSFFLSLFVLHHSLNSSHPSVCVRKWEREMGWGCMHVLA